jgi:copper chaperone CopZ
MVAPPYALQTRTVGRMRAFVVEEAGCESCAARVRAALEPLAAVEAIEVDEREDVAHVRLADEVAEDAVSEALAAASSGSGHQYRLRA